MKSPSLRIGMITVTNGAAPAPPPSTPVCDTRASLPRLRDGLDSSTPPDQAVNGAGRSALGRRRISLDVPRRDQAPRHVRALVQELHRRRRPEVLQGPHPAQAIETVPL